MKASQIPAKIAVPFASGAGSNYIRPVPVPSQISTTNGAASFTDGFPPDTFIQQAAGGYPPDGRDMNGILNAITLWNQWTAAAGLVGYDSTFSSAIGGYPLGATLVAANQSGLWLSTADNNTTDPDTGGAGWVLIPNQNYPVASFTGNLPIGRVTGGAPIASPGFSGTPTAPTPALGDNSQRLATTAFVATGFARNGAVTYNSSTTLTNANAGQIVTYGGNGNAVFTLPLSTSSPPSACPLIILNLSSNNGTLSLAFQGSDVPSYAMPPLHSGQMCALVNISGEWLIIYNTSGSLGAFVVGPAVADNQAIQRGQPLWTFSSTYPTSSRNVNTTYTNSSAYPMLLNISVSATPGSFNLNYNSNSYGAYANVTGVLNLSLMVAPGGTYELLVSGGTVSIVSWFEEQLF